MIIFQNAKKPIAFLFPRLAALDAVEAALREKFGNRTPAIITKLKMRHPWGTKSWTSHDIIRQRRVLWQHGSCDNLRRCNVSYLSWPSRSIKRDLADE
jgi:hypothetical protein